MCASDDYSRSRTFHDHVRPHSTMRWRPHSLHRASSSWMVRHRRLIFGRLIAQGVNRGHATLCTSPSVTRFIHRFQSIISMFINRSFRSFIHFNQCSLSTVHLNHQESHRSCDAGCHRLVPQPVPRQPSQRDNHEPNRPLCFDGFLTGWSTNLWHPNTTDSCRITSDPPAGNLACAGADSNPSP